MNSKANVESSTPTTTVEQIQLSSEQAQIQTPKVNPIKEVLSADETNKKCVDCKKGKATCISVNNGITLCGECANLHVSFGKGISFVHPIDDEWDTYLLTFLKKGGNAKFVAFCDENGISSMPPENRYMTRAVDYYRRNLKADVLNLGKISKDYAKAEELIDNPINCFPEFTNYVLPSQNKPKEPEPNAVVGWLKKMSISITTGAKSLKEKFKATKFAQQLTIANEKVGEQLKKAGTYIAEKSTVVGEKMKIKYADLKTKIASKNNEGEKGVEVSGSENGKEEKKDYDKIDNIINNVEKIEEKKEEITRSQPGQSEPAKPAQ